MSEKEGKSSKMKKILLAFVSIIISIVVAVMSSSLVDRLQETIDDIVENELDSMVQDAVDSSIDDLETMEPDEQKYVSGVWTFNDTLPLFENGDSIGYDIAFTSNGKSYTFIECYNTPGPVGDVTINYYVEKTGIVGSDCDNAYESGWVNDDYRLVDFGSIPQFVSEEFYTWLTANATQQ